MSTININSDIIRLFCSRIAVPTGVKPYEPSEWSNMAKRLLNAGLNPYDLEKYDSENISNALELTDEEKERISKLLGRATALTIELQNYEKIG